MGSHTEMGWEAGASSGLLNGGYGNGYLTTSVAQLTAGPPWFPVEVVVVMSVGFPTRLDPSAFCVVLVGVAMGRECVCTPWHCRNLYFALNLAYSGPWHFMNRPI